ncbi:ATP-dependent DNA ligase [Nocardia gipuzkoensis]
MSVPAPMLATAGTPPETPGRWAVEMKWDGMRTICRITRGRVELYSRNRNNVTSSYPELTSALAGVEHGTDMILDGEIVAPDPATGAPSFARLQQRMHLTRPTREAITAVPVRIRPPRPRWRQHHGFGLHRPESPPGRARPDRTWCARPAVLD